MAPALVKLLLHGGRHTLDYLYPRRCEGCRKPLPRQGGDSRTWLCLPCEQSLRPISHPFCRLCGTPYEGAISDSFQCGNCSGQRLHFDFAVSGYHAEGLMRELIHRYKYQRHLQLRNVLADLLLETLQEPRLAGLDPGQSVLVPVPLHPFRRWEREFNQSWELCRRLSRRTGIPALHALRRVRSTAPQARLSRAERQENLHHAFRLRPSCRAALRHRTVLLVDDVLTTGSTVSECARALRLHASPEKVVVITLAHG